MSLIATLCSEVLYRLPPAIQKLLQNIIRFCFILFSYRKHVIRANLRRVFSTESEDQINSRVAEFYKHFSKVVYELFFLFGPLKKFVDTKSEVFGFENWQTANAKGNGVLMLSSHLGNWEVMVAAGIRRGIPGLMITKHLKPEWLHKLVQKTRESCGTQCTYEPRTLRDVLAHIKRGGSIGIVLDQYAGPPSGIRVPFFGYWVGTQSAVAMIAKKTGAAVLPIYNYWDSRTGKYHVVIEPEVSWISGKTLDDEIFQNTLRYNQILERQISSVPNQWLWSHRRFKGDLTSPKQVLPL